MAQRLHNKYSPGMCVTISKRHSRLCTQIPGCEQLSTAIESGIANVVQKMAQKKVAEETRDGFYDLIAFHDSELDNKIRIAASRSKDYDLENPSSRTYETIFPQDTTQIIRTNALQEPAEVMKVVSRIQTLGSSHPLYSQAKILTEAADKVNEIAAQYLDSINKVGAADAELQIAKADLIRQYLSNMFEAEKLFGRKMADRLFPRMVRKSSSEEETENNIQEED